MINEKYKDKIQYFDSLSKNWDELAGNNNERILKIRDVFSMIELKSGANVMDVGCGTGILFPIIHDYIGNTGTIFAVDTSSKMIEEAGKRNADIKNIKYIISPLEEVNIPENSIDVIICFAVFPHIEDKQKALLQCRMLLNQTGALYIFHLADTKSLNELHHNLNGPVSRDYMPYKDELEILFLKTGFAMKQYIDKPELNFICAVPK